MRSQTPHFCAHARYLNCPGDMGLAGGPALADMTDGGSSDRGRSWPQQLIGRSPVKATQKLHDAGQSLWIDNITRDMLDSGRLRKIHRRAVGHRPDLQPDDLRQRDRQEHRLRRGDPRSWSTRERRARRCSSSWRSRIYARGRSVPADAPAHRRVDGWVSLEVSPLLAYDTQGDDRGGQAPASARPASRTCSSRSPAPRKGCRRSRRRSSPACRSTSRCCSRASNTSPRPTPT